MYGESRADADFRIERDASPHVFCQLFDECQPKAGATLFTRQKIGQLVKFLKDDFVVFGRDAGACIANRKRDFVLTLRNDQADLPGRGEFDGVAQQMVQYLT